MTRRYEGVPLRSFVDELRFPLSAGRSSCVRIIFLGAKAEAGRLLAFGDVTFEE